MSKVVNLNQFRKRKAREAAARQADENRVKFGRTKAQKQRDALEVEAARHRLEQLQREAAPQPAEPPEPEDPAAH